MPPSPPPRAAAAPSPALRSALRSSLPALLLVGLAGPATAHEGEPAHVLPEVVELQAAVDGAWTLDGPWRVSPARTIAGTRFGALLMGADDGGAVEVQLLDAAGRPAGPWRPARRHWRGAEGQEVWVLDLGGPARGARARISAKTGFHSVAWELRVPVDEPRRPAGSPPPPAPPPLDSALSAIGVVSRSTWGASATTCSSTEDDWYRYAIHHTAGGQTSGGTVQGAVQALQAYAMGSGGWCDIPYQFLVGYDGSLWEGRDLRYTSGATGGGQNDGNMALCFLGCYDDDACGSLRVEPTLQMMAAARLLAQTLAVEESTTTTTDTLKAHGQWPGNSTACPGDLVIPRLDELRSAAAHLQARVVWTDAPLADAGELVAVVGEPLSVTIELANDGLLSWGGGTALAPLPRDAASPLATADWLSPTRVATASAGVGPGGTATFVVPLNTSTVGTYELSLTLVEEWVGWFADAPIGGGFPEGQLRFTVRVEAPPEEEEPDPGADSAAGGGGGWAEDVALDSGHADGAPADGEAPPAGAGAPGEAVDVGKSGCSTAPSRGGLAAAALGALALLGGARRRRR